MAGKFLEYVMNNHHVSSKPVTILQAFQISLVRNFLSHLLFFYIIWLDPEISKASISPIPPTHPPTHRHKKKGTKEKK